MFPGWSNSVWNPLYHICTTVTFMTPSGPGVWSEVSLWLSQALPSQLHNHFSLLCVQTSITQWMPSRRETVCARLSDYRIMLPSVTAFWVWLFRTAINMSDFQRVHCLPKACLVQAKLYNWCLQICPLCSLVVRWLFKNWRGCTRQFF